LEHNGSFTNNDLDNMSATEIDDMYIILKSLHARVIANGEKIERYRKSSEMRSRRIEHNFYEASKALYIGMHYRRHHRAHRKFN